MQNFYKIFIKKIKFKNTDPESEKERKNMNESLGKWLNQFEKNFPCKWKNLLIKEICWTVLTSIKEIKEINNHSPFDFAYFILNARGANYFRSRSTNCYISYLITFRSKRQSDQEYKK